jgi:DNA-binding NtrC family response regulator
MKEPIRDALVVTRDGDLLHEVVASGAGPIQIRFDGASAAETLRSAPFALVVLDDEVLTESERAWMIDEVHRRQPGVPLVYVASRASSAIERTARIHGVEGFASKPLETKALVPLVRACWGRSRTREGGPHERTRAHDAEPDHRDPG